MEEKNLVESMEPLSDSELKDVAGGASTTWEFYCNKCGSKCSSSTWPFVGLTIKCPNCGVLGNNEFKRVEYNTGGDTIIDS